MLKLTLSVTLTQVDLLCTEHKRDPSQHVTSVRWIQLEAMTASPKLLLQRINTVAADAQILFSVLDELPKTVMFIEQPHSPVNS